MEIYPENKGIKCPECHYLIREDSYLRNKPDFHCPCCGLIQIKDMEKV